MGERLQIRVAFKDGKEIASILTLQHKDVVVYKYGCSDTAFQNLGGTQFLFWKTIVEAKAAGLTCMDFGRSDADNPGLIAFKDRWGAKSSQLSYLRWSRKQASEVTRPSASRVVKQFFALMPDVVLQATGRILYRHVG
jgi:CelD/BcsL family acetyltransferase involved in cellulose biosynthesis